MTETERRILLETARETIHARLEGRAPLYPEPTAALLEKRALFVTLRTKGKLRGCIGTLEPVASLIESVKDMAVSSAFKDPRFPPLRLEELGDLTIEISALTPLEQIRSLDEIEIGRHGLYAKKGLRSGVLLPQVPVEQGWNRVQFLEHTCRKAGLSPDEWKSGDVNFYSFEAEVFGEGV